MRPEITEDDYSQSKAAALVSYIKEYFTTIGELTKLKIIDKLSSGLSAVVASIILVLLISLVIILASIGTALWINECLGDSFSGFFIVAGFYLIVCFLVYLGKETLIKKSVTNKIIDHFLND
jgi:hypothetical protein